MIQKLLTKKNNYAFVQYQGFKANTGLIQMWIYLCMYILVNCNAYHHYCTLYVIYFRYRKKYIFISSYNGCYPPCSSTLLCTCSIFLLYRMVYAVIYHNLLCEHLVYPYTGCSILYNPQYYDIHIHWTSEHVGTIH